MPIRVASPVRAGLKSFFTRPFSQEKKCSYTAQKGPVVTGNNTLPQVFDFQAVTTWHVRMHVLNNWGLAGHRRGSGGSMPHAVPGRKAAQALRSFS